MKSRRRIVLYAIPVVNTKTGEKIGRRVRLSDGTSYFEQSKRVPRGACVNLGPKWERP